VASFGVSETVSALAAKIEITDAQKSAAKTDATGQDRFRRNVAFAWGGYLVNIIAGFVMPRLISDRLGQTILGVWDFAWSLVGYFALTQLGISSSVQRYVARYRALGEHDNLSRSVSTIGLSLRISAIATLLLTVATAMWIVPHFQARLGEGMETTRMVVLFLGAELAISMWLTVYGGIVVGCHRWDAHNLISAVGYAVMTVGMIAALMMGGGLVSLAAVHCVSMSACEVARWRLARKVCPEFVMNFGLANWKVWREQARFSAKSILPSVADLISNQSLSLLITMFLGPSALAIYSRPRNLMSQGRTMAAKFGSILIPTASSLQAQSDKAQLQATFIKSAAFLSMLAMPGIGFLIVFGNELMRVWMGSQYVYPGLITILAIGCFPSIIQEPITGILAGMNRHGRLALFKLAGSICCAIVLAIGLKFLHWQLWGAALAFAAPLFIVDSLVAPVLACRAVEVKLLHYLNNAYFKPLLGTVPIVLLLEIAKLTYSSNRILAGGCAVVAIAVVLAMCVFAFTKLKAEKRKPSVV
jgi:O-antigen/teichoic acid export membrane protein